jgi:hypothetical protein
LKNVKTLDWRESKEVKELIDISFRAETMAKQYFQNLGFNIREKDFEGRKKGADFFIELKDCIQSDEVKTLLGTWAKFLKTQLDRIRAGGLVALVSGDKVRIMVENDIENIIEIIVYRVVWRLQCGQLFRDKKGDMRVIFPFAPMLKSLPS